MFTIVILIICYTYVTIVILIICYTLCYYSDTNNLLYLCYYSDTNNLLYLCLLASEFSQNQPIRTRASKAKIFCMPEWTAFITASF